MNDCIAHEETLSAWLDGETTGEDAALALEHTLGCASCREFYLAARDLGRRLGATAAAPPAVPAPVWDRIRAQAGFERQTVVAWRGYGFLAKAAMLVVGLGAVLLLARGPAAPGAAEMSDARFVAMTRELLESDPRYQRTLYQVLRSAPALSRGESPEDGSTVRWIATPSRAEGDTAPHPRPRV
ncbi:MAG: zf-HC2 domain-containing protein [Thermoanaerobaculia bacterium]